MSRKTRRMPNAFALHINKLFQMPKREVQDEKKPSFPAVHCDIVHHKKDNGQSHTQTRKEKRNIDLSSKPNTTS